MAAQSSSGKPAASPCELQVSEMARSASLRLDPTARTTCGSATCFTIASMFHSVSSFEVAPSEIVIRVASHFRS